MTRLVRFSNNAVSKLAANITSTSTTITLQTGDGAKFPALTGTQYFMATLVKADGTTEVVKVTARSTDTLTVVRAAEAVAGVQTSYAFSSGDRIEHRLTAGVVASELDRLDQAAYINPLNKSANYTVTANDVTSLIRVNTGSGAVTITLPEISTLTEDFDVIVAKVTADTNVVTVARGGTTDTINGATTYSLTGQWQGAWLTADRSTGTWTVIASGGAGVKANVDTFTGSGTAGPFTLSGDPGVKENTAVYVGGVYQQKSTYTLVGTSLTLGGTVATGVPIEVIWAQPLQVGITSANQTTASDGASGSLFTTVQGFIDKLKSSVGSALVGFIQSGTGATQRTVQDELRDRVSVKQFGAVGNGVANDYAAIQAAHDALPADGGTIYFPRGVYSVATKLRITKRNVRFIGENKYNTYIAPTVAVIDAPIHVMGFSFELANMTVYSPSGVGGYCVWSRGAGDLYIHDNVLMNGGSNNTGYGIVLEDVNESLTFVPGAYRHRIERNFISTGGNYFNYGIVTGANCTGGGMNACVFGENHIIASNGISLAVGGGNLLRGNLLQSATGGNSGSRPYTGGAGYGCAFGGELHAVGNYFERFAYDFYPTSSSAVYSVVGHSSDATNEIYPSLSGYSSPVFCETGYGISAEKLDIQVSPTITANGTTLPTNRRALRLAGNGGQYTGLLLSTVGAKEGQLITLYNNSYAMHFADGSTIDLDGFGSQLILGQQGLSLNGTKAHGNTATFMFTESGLWRLVSVSKHGPSAGGSLQYSFSGNGETLPTNTPYVNITGGGAARSGALLAAGLVYGQTLIITANSWAVTFAAGAASWSSAGAPTLGNGTGQCMSVQLVYTESGWYEVSRTVR